MRRLALLLEYDGTGFAGSQLQPGRRTVQGQLEKAIEGFLGAPERVAMAGRTDAGVHACGQVAAFTLAADYPPETVRSAVNARLPADLVVRAVLEAPAGFDPRRHAVARCYRYRVLAADERSPLRRGETWWVPGKLDLHAMREAGAMLMGRHDFRAFAAGPSRAGASTVREMRRVAVERRGREIVIEMEANAFLPHQVRITVSALVRAGQGRVTAGEVAALLGGGETAAAGAVAPAQGLCLEWVQYKDLNFDVDEEEDAGDL